MNTKAELQEQLRKASSALREIEAAERDEANRSAIGKCYKYRNSYSCPQSDDDYWWLYMKVIGTEDGHLVGMSFQRDKYGEITVTPRKHEGLNGVLSGYREITEDEMRTAWLSLSDEMHSAVSAAFLST